MQILIIVLALGLLMGAAYRGASVILFAPIAALAAVLLTDPALVLPLFSAVFMERMVGFIKLYFPVFLLGAIFGKLMEITGFAKSIIQSVLRFTGPEHAIVAVVLVCALLTYGGVSLFVVAFAVYPFGAELFRAANIPKRLLPATIALGAFTFTMDALPGTPQIQNIIPTTFFGTTSWAAPRLGLIGSALLFASGVAWLQWKRRIAARRNEGYGAEHKNEPVPTQEGNLAHPALAVAPLVVAGSFNLVLTWLIPHGYPGMFDFVSHGILGVPPLDASKMVAIWAVEGALVSAILLVLAWWTLHGRKGLQAGLNAAVGGAILAALNTGSEYGFGAVISALPGFNQVSGAVSSSIQSPLVNVAVTTTVLAGITGSASGGMSIALAAMGATYLNNGLAAGIPAEVLHRVAAMASGGMDTLPHNGAVITLLAITGLTHRESYSDIFALTILKTVTVFAVILIYQVLHIV
jgi:H+/gluconate symporter-like permease